LFVIGGFCIRLRRLGVGWAAINWRTADDIGLRVALESVQVR
jgi:hypothetical protein